MRHATCTNIFLLELPLPLPLQLPNIIDKENKSKRSEICCAINNIGVHD